MNLDIFTDSIALNLPKLIVSNEQRIIHSGQETNTAFYILKGCVANEHNRSQGDKLYQEGEVVCLRDFLGSDTYSAPYKAFAGTTILCLTVDMFKEIILSGDKFAWSLSKILASEPIVN